MSRRRRRRKKVGLSKHHRLPTSRGGTNSRRNISIVREDHHNAFHLLFSNRNVWELAKLLNDIWIDPDYHLVVKRRPRNV